MTPNGRKTKTNLSSVSESTIVTDLRTIIGRFGRAISINSERGNNSNCMNNTFNLKSVVYNGPIHVVVPFLEYCTCSDEYIQRK